MDRNRYKIEGAVANPGTSIGSDPKEWVGHVHVGCVKLTHGELTLFKKKKKTSCPEVGTSSLDYHRLVTLIEHFMGKGTHKM